MMKKLKIGAAFVLFFCLSKMTAQETVIFNKVQKEINKGNFKQKSNVLTLSKKVFFKKNLDYFKDFNKVTFLEYHTENILTEKNKNITLELPVEGKKLILDLIEVSEKFYSYNLVTSSGKTHLANNKNKHYRGIIRNNKKSLVAISFFKDEIIGTISYEGGTYNIVKEKKSNTHLLYKDSNLKAGFDFHCDTPSTLPFKGYDKEMLLSNKAITSSSQKCVELYFETEYDIFQSKGSVTNVENYITGLYNQVATIYENENINTKISEIKIWNTVDPYTATNTRTLLSQFQNQISNFNGTLGQLLTFRNVGGGIAAGFNGICNSNKDLSLSVSAINSTFRPFPTYSWSVMVVTHEFGHLFGSRHTHACVWNGNNTAIDGCSGFTEGNCSIPGIPSQGGTIMSYCHIRNVGINFSLGFGLQPSNVIRNRVNSANCLSACENCQENLTITQNVNSGQTDNQQASNSITATNTINNGATVSYDAGNTVFLKPGFHAKAGATFSAFIAGCSQTEQKDFDEKEEITSQETIDTNVLEEENSPIKIYPNPTNGLFKILSAEIITSYTFLNQFNRTLLHKKADKKTIEVDIQHLSKGIYLIQLQLNSGKMITKKIIKY